MCACRGTAGFAHVSCLAEQAKILVAEAEENNFAHSLVHTGRYDEARSLSREKLPVARRALGNDHPLVFKLRGIYAETFLHDESSTRGDLDEAVSVVEDVIQRSQRVFGAAHPETQNKLRLLKALKTERSSRA